MGEVRTWETEVWKVLGLYFGGVIGGLHLSDVSGIVGLLKTVVAGGLAFSVRYVTCFGSVAADFLFFNLLFSFYLYNETHKKKEH